LKLREIPERNFNNFIEVLKVDIATAKQRQSGKINWVTAIPIVIFHILAVVAFFYFSWTHLAVALVMWWLMGSVGIGLSFHRQLTHRGFQSSNWLKRLLAVFGSMALQGSPNDWITTHRLHHQFTDTEQDPHSPRYGLFFSHVGWVLRGTSQDNSDEIEKRYIPDLLKDEFLVKLSKYWYLPTIAAGIILGLIGGLPMVLWGIILPVTFGWHFTWFVNSVTHVWGSQRFESGDDSTNNFWVAMVSFGEGWHNNHHAHPTSAKHGLVWYEIDFNWIQIKILEKLGLVWNVKVFDLKAHQAKQNETALAVEDTPEFWQQAA
jgi:fatty-acid desaturase